MPLAWGAFSPRFPWRTFPGARSEREGTGPHAASVPHVASGRELMDGTSTDPPAASPTPAPLLDLRAEVRGTLLLFLLTLAVTGGVALLANVLVRGVG